MSDVTTSAEKPYDPNAPLWSIMTKSRGGTVSVIRDLTLEQARRTYERLDPWYGQHSDSLVVHKDFVPEGGWHSSMAGRGGITCSDGDIEIREVFGPAGWTEFAPGEIANWPIHHVVYVDADWNILPDEYQEEPELAEHYRIEREFRKSWEEERKAEAADKSHHQATDQRRGLFGWEWFA